MIEKIFIRGLSFNATGEIDVNTRKVTIYKGSYINPRITDVYGEKTFLLKERLIENKVLVNNTFMHDFVFDYPATASALISGGRPGYAIIKLSRNGQSIQELFQ